MQRVVALDPGETVDRLLDGGERDQARSRREVAAPSGVLHDGGTSRGQVAGGPVAEPSGPVRDVGVLRHPELGLRPPDEVAIAVRGAGYAHRVDRRPAVLAQQFVGPVDGQLETRRGARRQVDEPDELPVLVAVDVREALRLPGHDGGEAVAGRWAVGTPQAGHDRLPGLVPREPAGRDIAGRGTDVGAEREEVIELPEEVDVPGDALRDGELREHRVRVDEDPLRDRPVLVTPEPAAARQVDVQIRVAAVVPQPVPRPAVVRLVVVDEAPAVAQPMRRQGIVDVARAVGGVLGDGVGVRVVDALAGVLEIADLVAEVAQPEQVHQRAPGDAAERIAPDDAGEEDSHGGVQGRAGSAVSTAGAGESARSGSSSEPPLASRSHIRRYRSLEARRVAWGP